MTEPTIDFDVHGGQTDRAMGTALLNICALESNDLTLPFGQVSRTLQLLPPEVEDIIRGLGDNPTGPIDPEKLERIREPLKQPKVRLGFLFNRIESLASPVPGGDRKMTPTHRLWADKVLEWDDDVTPGDDLSLRAREELAFWLADASELLYEHVAIHQPDGSPWQGDDRWWLDEALIAWLPDQLHSGTSAPDRWRADSVTRWATCQDESIRTPLLDFWGEGLPSPTYVEPIIWAIEHHWYTELKPVWRRKQNRKPAGANGVRHDADIYAKAPKATAAVQTRGPNGEATHVLEDVDNSLTQIEGETYSDAPKVVQYVAQRWGLSAGNPPDPHEVQMPLAFDEPEDDSIPLALRSYNDSQSMLKPTVAKLLVGMQLLAPRDGALCEIELGTLTEWVNQGKARPGQKRERKKVRENIRAIRQLEVPTIDGGTLNLSHHVQMFEVHPPSSLDQDATVIFGRTRGFQQVLQGFETAGGTYQRLNGHFVMNADGFMRISGDEPNVARMYLTICSLINDQRWSGSSWTNLTKLSQLAHTLSVPAQKYLAGSGGNGNALRSDRSDTEAMIRQKLVGEYGLIDHLETRGRGRDREIKIEPTEAHEEAWERIREERDQLLTP
jgi:hypothetical protein